MMTNLNRGDSGGRNCFIDFLKLCEGLRVGSMKWSQGILAYGRLDSGVPCTQRKWNSYYRDFEHRIFNCAGVVWETVFFRRTQEPVGSEASDSTVEIAWEAFYGSYGFSWEPRQCDLRSRHRAQTYLRRHKLQWERGWPHSRSWQYFRVLNDSTCIESFNTRKLIL